MAIERLNKVGESVTGKYEKILDDLKDASRKFGLPVALDLTLVAFRGSRVGTPEGLIVASCAGVLHLLFFSIRQMLVWPPPHEDTWIHYMFLSRLTGIGLLKLWRTVKMKSSKSRKS